MPVRGRTAPGRATRFAPDAGPAAEALAPWLQARFGWRMEESATVEPDFPSANNAVLERIAQRSEAVGAFVVVLPAGMPPIASVAKFLRAMRKASGEEADLLVVLLGPPTDGKFASPDPAQVGYWKNFAARENLDASIEPWTAAA